MAEITYLGHSCVRIRGREGIVLIDPFDRSVGLDIGKPTAHIVAVSHKAPDHNNVAAVKPMKETLFVADGPGEYEVNNILIRGVRTAHTDKDGKKQGHNTVYIVHVDDIAFCHLGDLGHTLTASQMDEIGAVDVLFAPVGNGTWVMKPDVMSEVISEVEPKMVIPLYNDNPQASLDEPHLVALDTFVHQMGLKEFTPVEKLTVSHSSLPRDDEETQIAILKPVGASV
ncbi:MAG TPA: MBL fold metallo-hydrolase [Herpetosiphonaceae bacterium]|nr:MBL fold metallo-hydrolase [Herpetosiphonaceae bacterium]